jgi:hypothetical protein
MLPKKKAMKIEEMPPKFPGAKRIKLLYGPYKLRAANVGLSFMSIDFVLTPIIEYNKSRQRRVYG